MQNEPNLSKRPEHPTNQPVSMSKNISESSVSSVAKNKKMSNEPNFAQRTSSIKGPESIIEQKMSNEPNSTSPELVEGSSVEGNYEQMSNEPNFKKP